MEDIDKISEQILRILSGGDPAIETKIELAEIKRLVKLYANDLGFEDWVNNKQLEGQSNVNAAWLVDYAITLFSPSELPAYATGVLATEKLGLLPASYLKLPQDGGFHNVYYVDSGKRKKIVYLPPNVFAQDRTDVQRATSKYFFTLKAGKIIITNSCPNERVIPTSIIATMAVATEATIDDVRGAWIIQKVLPILQVQMGARVDNVANNNPTP